MKKLFILILAVLFSLSSFSGLALAKNESVKINEYLYIKELQNKTDDELKSMDLDDEAIVELRNIDYAKEIKRRSKLDEKELRELGYSNDKIQMLKKFKGTEEELIAIAATCDLYAWTSSYTYDSVAKRTYFRVGFNWTWDSLPIFNGTDIVAFSWAPDMYQDTSTSQTYHKVQYYSSTYQRWGSTVSVAIDPQAPGRGASSKIKMIQSGTSYWAKYGSGFIRVSAAGYLRDVAMLVSYGHQTLSLSSPTVSFPAGGSISFGSGVEEEDYVYLHEMK